MKQETSKMIRALENFCVAHAGDPNLFPRNKDVVDISSNTMGAIISEHPECSSDDLAMINNYKAQQELEGQKDSINA